MFWFYLHQITVNKVIKYTQSADYPFGDIAAYIFQHFPSIITMCTRDLWGGSLRYHQASSQHSRQCQQRSAQAPIGRAPFRMTQCPGSLPTSQRSLGYRLYSTCLVDIHSVHLFSVVKIPPQDSHPYSHPHRDIVIRVGGFLKKEASQRCIPHTQIHRMQLSRPYPNTLETQNQTLHLILQKASQSLHPTLGKINQSLHPILEKKHHRHGIF